MTKIKDVDPNNPFEIFSEQKNGHLKSFTDELMNMKGEMLEFFISETAENLSLDQVSTPIASSIMGKLVEVYDRFVLIDCLYIDRNTKEICSGNHIWLNSFQIRFCTKLNSRGTVRDVLLNSTDADKIRKLLHLKHGKTTTK